jgi:hypothetical protein
MPLESIISRESVVARAQIDWLTLTPTAPPSELLRRYQRLQNALLGRWRFARLARARMPLLRVLGVRFEELRVGLCRNAMDAHRRVCSHQGSIDPVSIGALAQLSANMVIEISAPQSVVWSVRGMTIEQLRPARSTVMALARLDKTDWANTASLGVPVTISDAAGAEIARAVVSFALAARSD